MNERVIRSWIDVLRSGKYKQCGGRLCDNRFNWETLTTTNHLSYCCLGVLEELHRKEDKGIKREKVRDGYRYYDNFGNSNTHLLKSTKKLVGISNKLQEVLINMNDTNKNFNEIADFLERKLEQSLKRRKRAKTKPTISNRKAGPGTS